jgi:5-methylcytosine-specific restriction endonuclease McrA
MDKEQNKKQPLLAEVDTRAEQLDRLTEAGIISLEKEIVTYLAMADVIITAAEVDIPVGYKRCGGCKKIKKLYLFNRNSSAKNNCTGNCKDCQKISAKESYEKNKGKRDYKAYYQENSDKKKESGRAYYSENKEKILERQKSYRHSSTGKKVMKMARKRRRFMMDKNAGIPWTRALIIDRDRQGNEFPSCYLCGSAITKDSALHMEHVIPIVLGGKDCFTNVACAHELCNLRKSKDAREITAEQVEGIIDLAERYIESHKPDFPELFPVTK